MEYIISLILLALSQFIGEYMPTPEVATSQESVLAQVVSVIDGDTIWVSIDGQEEKVRYIGIDTPEPYKDGEPACYSKEATTKNKELVVGRQVELVADTEDRDKYKRLLRYVYVDNEMVNEVLVAEGYATIMTIKPNTAFASTFKTLEDEARAGKIGLWSVCVD